MQQTTVTMNRPLTIANLRRVVEVENEITKAISLLGYNPQKHKLTMQPCFCNTRYIIGMDGSYFGIWDVRRRTFVD